MKAIEASSPSKQRWFLNPWFDILFVLALPLVFIAPVTGHLYKWFPLLGKIQYPLFNLSHVVSGLIIAYLFFKGRKRSWPRYAVGPILISLGGIALFATGLAFYGKLVRFFWGVGHNINQQFQILSLSQGSPRNAFKIDDRLNVFVLSIWFLNIPLGFSHQLLEGQSANNGFGHLMLERSLTMVQMLAWPALIVFAARQVYVYVKTREMHHFKIIFISAAFLINYLFPVRYIKDAVVAWDTVILAHNMQYISWVWLHLHRRNADTANGTDKILLNFAKTKYVPLYGILLLSFGAIIFAAMKSTHHFECIQNVLACIHFYLDGMLWGVYARPFGM